MRRHGNNHREDRDENQHNRNNRNERNRVSYYERPKWTPPQIPQEPLPSLECHYCGKPIRDIASAITDRGSDKTVHFDCVIARIIQEENPEKGETVAYIGGGRFGIVRFNDPRDPKDPTDPKKFSIRKEIEWEKKDNRAVWRSQISDHYSVT